MSKRWSKAEIKFLRDRLKTESLYSIADQLGRTWNAVRTKVGRIGLRPVLEHMRAEHLAEIRRLHAMGMCDPEISEHLGFDRSTVGYRRRKLGLGSNARSDRQHGRLCRGLQKQCERLGISSPGELRNLSWSKYARAHGWPSKINGLCITRRQVDILDALYDYGPQTRVQIAKRLGMPIQTRPTKTLSSRGGGRSYLRELIDSGLVINLGRVVKSETPGSGKCTCLYAIAITVERNFDA